MTTYPLITEPRLSERARPARLPLLPHPPTQQIEDRLHRFSVATDQLVLQARRRKPREQQIMHGLVGRAVRLIRVLNARCHSVDFSATARGRLESIKSIVTSSVALSRSE